MGKEQLQIAELLCEALSLLILYYLHLLSCCSLTSAMHLFVQLNGELSAELKLKITQKKKKATLVLHFDSAFHCRLPYSEMQE